MSFAACSAACRAFPPVDSRAQPCAHCNRGVTAAAKAGLCTYRGHGGHVLAQLQRGRDGAALVGGIARRPVLTSPCTTPAAAALIQPTAPTLATHPLALSLYRTVVLPALSRPTMSSVISCCPNSLQVGQGCRGRQSGLGQWLGRQGSSKGSPPAGMQCMPNQTRGQAQAC